MPWVIWNSYEKFATTNVTWTVGDIPPQIEEIPQLKFNDLESELFARKTQIQGLSLDKILELMHQINLFIVQKGNKCMQKLKCWDLCWHHL